MQTAACSSKEFNSQRIALKMVGFEDKQISDMWKFPATKRDMLNKLQMRRVLSLMIE